MERKHLLPVAIWATLILVAGPAEASPNAADARNGLIAFQSNRAGSNDIYTVRPDGSHLVRLTSVVGPNRRPRWSPDGSRIAFQSNRDGNAEIYVMKADGSNQTRLTNNVAVDDFPDWTSDGRRIIFQRGAGASAEIYRINDAGGNEINLSNDPAADITPAASPTNGKIAFASDRSGSSLIYTMRADGGAVQAVTVGAGFDFAPNWSPDGREIAFLRDTTGTDNDIFAVRADGTGLRRLTTTPNRIEFGVSWSPDERRLVFGGCATDCHLYTMSTSGGNERQITSTTFGPQVSVPYSENFNNNAFNPAFWTSFGPTGVGRPGPTITATNGQVEFAFAGNTVADPSSGVAAVQMVSRCPLAGDFDFQIDYRLLDWPPGNGVNFALGAESLNSQAALSLSRLSDPTERYGGFNRLADGSITFGELATTDQQGTLRLARVGPVDTAFVLSGGDWVPIVSAPASSDDLQVTLTAFTQDALFGHQPVEAAFDNFRLSSGSFDPTACSGVADRFPDWQARDG
jgi:hypothetical protein